MSTEKTDAGEQIVAPGVKPLTELEQEEQRRARIARNRKQEDYNIGLFDEAQRDQVDLMDLIASKEKAE